jgi:hypothetical protein
LEFTWESVEVPIKRCEFIRARRRFIGMPNAELDDLVSSLVLASLAADDREFIVNNMSPTLEEALNGTAEDKTNYLWYLMKMIMYNYRKYKLLFYESVKNADLPKALFCERRIFFHYEALRNLKRKLMGGKDLMYIDMPEYTNLKIG